MHVSNHLISPEAAILGGVVATTLVVVAVKQLRGKLSNQRLAMAGVLGAFVFAAQMFNYPLATIGCSGHLVGGVLLAALLGPWLGFLTLSGVLLLQSLLFADGGIMALGWNIINMAAIGALVAYPLIFRPMTKASFSSQRVFSATLLASFAAIVLGALAVVAESSASGISSLPSGEFVGYMLPIHLLIGACEGLIGGAILLLVARREPALLESYGARCKPLRVNYKRAFATFAISALVIGGIFSLMASSHPDGLEWAINQTLSGDVLQATSSAQLAAESLQQRMALAPDYVGSYTGLIATATILLATWIFVGFGSPKHSVAQQKATSKK